MLLTWRFLRCVCLYELGLIHFTNEAMANKSTVDVRQIDEKIISREKSEAVS